MNDSLLRTYMIIRSVLPNSSAARAGLQVGDRVLSLDGQPIMCVDDFIRRKPKYGSIFRMEVLRAGQVICLTVDDTTTTTFPAGTDMMQVLKQIATAQPIITKPTTLN